MALHASAFAASDNEAVHLADICARADVELLRYPVPIHRQTKSQTMAVGAIEACLRRYGEDTLITALQCVTQTTNNKPGALSARIIKAMCAVLHGDQERRDCGLALLEMFDGIDLRALQTAALADAAAQKVSVITVLTHNIRLRLDARQWSKDVRKTYLAIATR
jgi:hypothetical protein